jgi:organic radical activating enzyme
MISGKAEALAQTKKNLDLVSPSFCLAKWLQVTLHLQNGSNHSCHHPTPHQTPLEELARDPSALHNTEYKKMLRAMMLRGERPEECDYCWRVEDAPGSHFSDRMLKSTDFWARPRLAEIAASDPAKNVNPSYLEVSFGNECNFRCSYCDPQTSSAVWSSYERHGAYVGRFTLEEVQKQGRAPLKNESNPYVKAFWDWFPNLAPDLKVFRITGGEPLINQNTFRVLDYIEANPLPNLLLCVNSNFGVPEVIFRKFLEKLKSLTASGKISNFKMFTSIDTHGAQAEYLRVGLNYQRWLARVRTYLEEVPWNITFMVTFNVLSLPHFQRLLADVTELNRDFIVTVAGKKLKRTGLDISHLTHPEYLSSWILNERWLTEISHIREFMEKNAWENIGPHGFSWHELFKIKRIEAWAIASANNPPADLTKFRALFYLFTKQFAEREGKEFLAVFPEMEDFYQLCKDALKSKGENFAIRHLREAPNAAEIFPA